MDSPLNLSDGQMERLAILTEIKRLDSEIAAADALAQGMIRAQDHGVSSIEARFRAESLRESQRQLRVELGGHHSPSLEERPLLASVDQSSDLRD